ncbi:hypothetical protein [Deinococcus kurensis]|uniref:hypothetical protein n=1 Tax=Deinococcus kurensis TaxID=2662757 RepID=UPI0012D30E4F|nr:hypothetical protein [Deinococcus kurensis]
MLARAASLLATLGLLGWAAALYVASAARRVLTPHVSTTRDIAGVLHAAFGLALLRWPDMAARSGAYQGMVDLMPLWVWGVTCVLLGAVLLLLRDPRALRPTLLLSMLMFTCVATTLSLGGGTTASLVYGALATFSLLAFIRSREVRRAR